MLLLLWLNHIWNRRPNIKSDTLAKTKRWWGSRLYGRISGIRTFQAERTAKPLKQEHDWCAWPAARKPARWDHSRVGERSWWGVQRRKGEDSETMLNCAGPYSPLSVFAFTLREMGSYWMVWSRGVMWCGCSFSRMSLAAGWTIRCKGEGVKAEDGGSYKAIAEFRWEIMTVWSGAEHWWHWGVWGFGYNLERESTGLAGEVYKRMQGKEKNEGWF